MNTTLVGKSNKVAGNYLVKKIAKQAGVILSNYTTVLRIGRFYTIQMHNAYIVTLLV
jgi:hypothetical protein